MQKDEEEARLALELEQTIERLGQAITERDRREMELRAKSPKRSDGHAVADVAHLPLFVAANEPSFL